MNRYCSSLLLCAAYLLLSNAPAATLVQFPTGSAAWQIDIIPAPKDLPVWMPPGNAGGIKMISITRTGETSRSIITWNNGKTTERWTFGNLPMAIATDTHDGSPSMLTKDDIAMGGDFSIGFDAASLQWVAEKNLKETVPFQGKRCLHYVAKVVVYQKHISPDGGVKEVPISIHCEAWIDEKTFLPVAAYDGSKMGLFTFLAPPATELKAPAAIQNIINQYAAAARPLK